MAVLLPRLAQGLVCLRRGLVADFFAGLSSPGHRDSCVDIFFSCLGSGADDPIGVFCFRSRIIGDLVRAKGQGARSSLRGSHHFFLTMSPSSLPQDYRKAGSFLNPEGHVHNEGLTRMLPIALTFRNAPIPGLLFLPPPGPNFFICPFLAFSFAESPFGTKCHTSLCFHYLAT